MKINQIKELIQEAIQAIFEADIQNVHERIIIQYKVKIY